jgi:hypothetical protein
MIRIHFCESEAEVAAKYRYIDVSTEVEASGCLRKTVMAVATGS